MISFAGHRVYGPEDRITQEGASADGLLMIVRGQVEFYQTKNGQTELVGTETPGALLGIEALLTGIYSSTIRAQTPVDALWIPMDKLKKLLASEPKLLERLMQLLHQAWESGNGLFVPHPDSDNNGKNGNSGDKSEPES
ncbi:Crp/Fnr family transcriptional regulator [Dongshaea marina]|uniref:Crp/Fnr family transcriptional regulator n=1 Tax=Dongshaea marina TaxID=2047966 RepID=UPI001901C428|nr:cyclic nucleotide-binding domain-containing protein [Dongshaea marina]